MKFYEDLVYIKMCEKATEIQDIWQSMCRKSEGDNYFWNYHFEEGYKGSFYINNDNASLNLINGFSECVDYEYCSKSLNGNTDIWLPRQDQLQEMIENIEYSIHKCQNFPSTNMYYKTYYYSKNEKREIMMMGNSEYSLLLQMVMSIHFNKTWDTEKEDWI